MFPLILLAIHHPKNQIMKGFTIFRALTLSFFLTGFALIPTNSFSQGTDACTSPTPLTVSTTCSVVTGDLQAATNSLPAGGCGGATATTTMDVWFGFTATSSNATITVNNLGMSLATTTTYVQVLSGTCGGTMTSVACQTVATSLVLTTLVPGTYYYVRVYVTGSTTSGGSANKRGFDICLATSPNDNCANAVSLTSNTTCSTTTSTLNLATATTGVPAGCSAGTRNDVWFSFSAASAVSQTVTISGLGTNFTSPEVQIFSGGCGTLASLGCGTTSATVSGLTVGTVYYVRVSQIGTALTTNGGFSICVTHPAPPPANDDCVGAISLTPGVSCSNTTGTLISATASTGIPVGCASGSTHYDVWYKFVAASTYELTTVSGLGTAYTSPEIQVFSGACGTLSSLGCGTTSVAVSGLTIGNTYYVRVSNLTTQIFSNGGFSICVYHPAAATYDYGKSYVNLTRNSGGGTLNVGDTLEIRATLVVRSSSLDSLSFLDTLHAGGGARFVPGSIVLRTNEGKAYKSFSDALDTDAGWWYLSGTDTVIRINMGPYASAVARGGLSSTSKPSVFNSTCIIMATYRVVVYAPYNSNINVGGGKFTIRDVSTTIASNLSFQQRNALVYSSPGLCPNAVSATNTIGGDFNGTFGTPAVSAPLARNRGTSVNVPSYIYQIFQTGNGPNDYYYGIANNTSATFSILNNWPKTDAHRVFDVWDVIGDHTGATNTAKGNAPCDTTKPVSTTNPCGYMLVINSAYKTDTAFQYSVTNLCPNTYYEISAWIRNICSKCSCDSNGTGASGAGYIPFATGDSSGIQPNLAFDINGTDYYTTGNIVHTGSTANQQRGSDSTNRWVKRGFTYLTGPSQSSLTLSIRNNAPGGGGNDWAIDDITLATCLPNMQYSPSLVPIVCDSNSITINDTIRSYFNNYTYYKWQRSSNGGATWSDVTATLGPSTPTWNGSAYEYITTYTVPPNMAYVVNNGDKYRVIVSTTSPNMSNTNCQVTDGVSIITLNVIDCGVSLKVDMLTFNGKLLSDHGNLAWTTANENEPLKYIIERSNDGYTFSYSGTVNSYNDYNSVLNHYSYIDPVPVTGRVWYRLVTTNDHNEKKYSRTILLSGTLDEFSLSNVINPFHQELQFEVKAPVDTRIDVTLLDMSGKTVRRRNYFVAAGVNSLSIDDTQALAPGVYLMQIKNDNTVITKKVVKQ
jgi:hypothetical protein